jgi:hypothetical protein
MWTERSLPFQQGHLVQSILWLSDTDISEIRAKMCRVIVTYVTNEMSLINLNNNIGARIWEFLM